MADLGKRKPSILIISGSLNPQSRSRILALELARIMEEKAVICQAIDLRQFALPLCDGEDSYSDPNVEVLGTLIRAADAIIIGVPVYNYYINAAVKNLVELTGSAWDGKPVGFLCAAGGRSSYMSVMSFANSMMLDFRCWILPRFIYAVGADFKDTEDGEEILCNPEICTRLQDMADETIRMAGAIHGISPTYA